MRARNKTKQLETTLRKQIRRGKWACNSRLPAEDALMAQFNVSRPSMREALNTLASEGIIERRHGSGTYVRRVPVGRIAIFARLGNITSPMGYWHRDLISNLDEQCRTENLRIELLVVHGRNREELMDSFMRSLQFLPSAEFEGAVGLTALPHFDETLSHLGIPHVTLSGGISGQGASVILDYLEMSRMMRSCMKEHGYDDYMVMRVEDPAEAIGDELYQYLEECCNILTDGKVERKLSLESIDDAQNTFLKWWDSKPSCRGLVFFDDALCEMCCKAIWEKKILIPDDLAIMTHANTSKDFILPAVPYKIGFCPEETAGKVWELLSNVRNGRKSLADKNIYISPVMRKGNSL